MDDKAINDIQKSIESVSLLVDGLENLSGQLKKFTDSYADIDASVSEARKIEEKASADLTETLPLMQSITEQQTEGSKKLEQLTAVLESTSRYIKETSSVFQETLSGLKFHREILTSASQSLKELNLSMEQTPSLAESSRAIQKALGAISDPDGLKDISEKLDEQTKAIILEKKEIIEPLKNAAAFSEEVRKQSDNIQNMINSQFDMMNKRNTLTETKTEEKFSELMLFDNSLNDRLEALLDNTEQIRAFLDNISQSSAKSLGRKGLLGKKSKETAAAENMTPKELIMKSVCVIEKAGWKNEYVMAVEYADDSYAYGYIYKYGKPYANTKTGNFELTRCPVSEGSFHLYTNEKYLRMIQEQEYNRRFNKEKYN